MKKILLLSVVGFFLLKGIALAHAPVIDINMATSILQIPIPSTVNIPINIVHDEVHQLREFRVTVEDSSGVKTELTEGISNEPFKVGNTNGCNIDVSGFTCNLVSNSEVDVTVPWDISAPGAYTVTARIQHRGHEVDEDEEAVTVTLISAEYPAPPAVANEYMNSNPGYFPKKNLTGSVRGCIINQIAKHHSAGDYGPKGGPYDQAAIYADAYAYYESCRR